MARSVEVKGSGSGARTQRQLDLERGAGPDRVGGKSVRCLRITEIDRDSYPDLAIIKFGDFEVVVSKSEVEGTTIGQFVQAGIQNESVFHMEVLP